MALDEGEASINQLIAGQAERVIVVADSSKIGLRAFARICTTSQIDALVTDTGMPEEMKAKFVDAGVQVLEA